MRCIREGGHDTFGRADVTRLGGRRDAFRRAETSGRADVFGNREGLRRADMLGGQPGTYDDPVSSGPQRSVTCFARRQRIHLAPGSSPSPSPRPLILSPVSPARPVAHLTNPSPVTRSIRLSLISPALFVVSHALIARLAHLAKLPCPLTLSTR
jgi:hypothetical protein